MTLISTINKTEYTLLQCLSQCLKQSDNLVSLPSLTAEEYQQLLTLADRHEVLSLLENVWEPARIPEPQSLTIQSKTARTVHKDSTSGIECKTHSTSGKRGNHRGDIEGLYCCQVLSGPGVS